MSEFEAARHNMVESQVKPSGVTDHRILAAMDAIAREKFVPEGKRSIAYIGDDLRIKEAGEGTPERYLMDPRTLGKLAELAALKATDLVLDVGPATGYSTALLAQLADTVVALECDPELVETANVALQGMGVDNAVVIEGALVDGNSKQGPFDVIFLNGSVPYVPDSLLAQLKEGGRLVAVVNESGVGKARLYTNSGGQGSYRNAFDAGIHLLPGFKMAESFTF